LELTANVGDETLPIGTILLGKYRVERVLGRGGMGVVVAVRHIELDELFALKVLHPDIVSDAQTASRFLREARAAARLTSEHVAKVHDVGRLEDGLPYMIMEHSGV
jgi:serine/threonine-protein kinase